MNPKRGWYSRGYLPHLSVEGVQFLTWRLADSLPASVVEKLKIELGDLAEDDYRREYARRIEAFCDSGQGSCFLKEPRIARVVQETLFEGDGESYELHAWVLMPNHVHTLMTPAPSIDLGSVMKSVKGASARKANAALCRSGTFWQRDYFDRRIRDSDHLERVWKYIEWNPVKAKLVTDPARWEFSSANPHSQKRLEVLRGCRGD